MPRASYRYDFVLCRMVARTRRLPGHHLVVPPVTGQTVMDPKVRAHIAVDRGTHKRFTTNSAV